MQRRLCPAALAWSAGAHTHEALARGVDTFGYGYLVTKDKRMRLVFNADLLY